MTPHQPMARSRITAVTACAALVVLGGCSTKPAPTAGASLFPTTTTSPSLTPEEADKAAIMKAYKAYDSIQKKLDAAKPITQAEIDAVSTGEWRINLTKISKVNPEKFAISTGPVKAKVLSISLTGARAILTECLDTTKTKNVVMPMKIPLPTPTEPIMSEITYIKVSGKWLISSLEEMPDTCQVGE